MKTESFITWILLGYIAWKIGQGSQVAGMPCGGSTSVPDFGLPNVLNAAWNGQATGGGLGAYENSPYMSVYELLPYMCGCHCQRLKSTKVKTCFKYYVSL